MKLMKRMRFPIVYSLSEGEGEIPGNPLMWAHYAAGSTGMALKLTGLDAYPGELRQVRYLSSRDMKVWQHSVRACVLEKRMRGAADDDLRDVAERIKANLLVKSDAWAYEKEWRIRRYVEDDPGLGAVCDRPGKIDAIYLGQRSSRQMRAAVWEVVKRYDSVPSVYVADQRMIRGRLHFRPAKEADFAVDVVRWDQLSI